MMHVEIVTATSKDMMLYCRIILFLNSNTKTLYTCSRLILSFKKLLVIIMTHFTINSVTMDKTTMYAQFYLTRIDEILIVKNLKLCVKCVIKTGWRNRGTCVYVLRMPPLPKNNFWMRMKNLRLGYISLHYSFTFQSTRNIL